MTDTDSTVVLTLPSDCALVLFELLSRLVRDENGMALLPLAHHDAELWALNSVVNRLESELADPLRDDYLARLDEARARVAERNGGAWPRDESPER